MPLDEYQPYVVRQGDYLDRLAEKHGFDADEVWGHSKNEALRSKRSNRNVLQPGDIVYLPVLPDRAGGVTRGTSNQYHANVGRVTLRLTFADETGPFANEPYVAYDFGEELRGNADGEGTVSLEVAMHHREGVVAFPQRGHAYLVRVGEMDPANEMTGARKRLHQLGYLPAESMYSTASTVDEDVREHEVIQALALFQRDNGLSSMDGTLNDETVDALVRAHGS